MVFIISVLHILDQDGKDGVSVLDGANILVLLDVYHCGYVKVIKVAELLGFCI